MTAQANGAGTIRRSPHAEASRAGERVVLFHGETETAVVLNPTGASIWTHLADGPLSEDSLCEKICAEFPDQPREQVAGDVAAFLEQMRVHRMIESGS